MPTIKRRPSRLRELLPHQTEGLSYGLRSWHPAWLMEMRLGKTLTAIRWAVSKRLNALLVIAPITVLEAWERELRMEGERFALCYSLDADRRDDSIGYAWERAESGRFWLLMNYESLLAMGEARTYRGKRVRDAPDVAWLPWDAVILDESTRIKNPTAQITKVCTRGFRPAKHRVILTGLPNPESDLDLVSQFLFLDGEFMGYSDYWHARAALFQKIGNQWFAKRGTHAAIKGYVHERAFIKTCVQARMPMRIQFQVRRVPMAPSQRKLYQEVEDDYAATLAGGVRLETNWILTQRLWLDRIAGGFDPEENLISTAKIDELSSLLSGELERKPVVVWFRFRVELLAVADRLRREGISTLTLMGGEPFADRKEKIAKFRRGGARVFLIMEQCAQYGVDVSHADVAVYYSRNPSNNDRQQSMRRIVDVKRGRTHLVIDLVTENSIDTDGLNALNTKGINSKLFLAKLHESMLSRRGKRAKDKTKAARVGASSRTATRDESERQELGSAPPRTVRRSAGNAGKLR